MISKGKFATKLLIFIGLISFLMILMPSPLAAQVEVEDDLETENEGNRDNKTLYIYGDRFVYTAGLYHDNESINILVDGGHALLQTDLSEATESLEKQLKFVIDVEGLVLLFKQLYEVEKMPAIYGKPYETKLAVARYIILSKIIVVRDTLSIVASMFPIQEGATSIICNSVFKENEIFYGIRMLADDIAEKIFKQEGIEYFSQENKKNPRVGFRDFKNMTEDTKYNSYRLLIPNVINSSLADLVTPKMQLIKPKIDENDFVLSDSEIANQRNLDVLVSGYFVGIGDTLQISCDVNYSTGKMITSKNTKIGKEDNMFMKIAELAVEINNEMINKME